MPAASWLRRWQTRSARGPSPIKRPSARRSAVRPQLERLEDRVQPSTVTWINPAGGNWSNSANWQDQSTGLNRVPGAADDAVIDVGANNFTVTHLGGSDSVHSLSDQAAFTLSGGSLALGSSAVVNGPFSFNGGTLAGVGGTGELIAAGGTTISGNSNSITGGFTLDLAAGTTNTFSATVVLYGASAIENDGTFQFNAGLIDGNGPPAQFRNTGTLIANNSGSVSIQDVAVIDSGLIQVQAGTLLLGREQNTVTATGRVTGAAGTTVDFRGGLTAAAGSVINVDSFTGGGTIAGYFRANTTGIGGGTTVMTGEVAGLGALTIGLGQSGSLDLSQATLDPGVTTLPSLTLTGGTLKTAATWTVTGALNFQGGGLIGAGGGGALVSDGTAMLGGQIALANGAVFDNEGNLTVETYANLAQAAGDTSAVLFRNAGTVVGAAAPSQWANVNVPIQSTGSFTAASGDLNLGVQSGPAADSTFSGPAVADAGANLYFYKSCGTATITGDISGTGTVQFAGPGTCIVGGAYQAGQTDIGGTVRFTGPAPAPGTLICGGGIIDFTPAAGGPETVTLDSLTLLNNATLSGTADIVVTGAALMTATNNRDSVTLAVPRFEAQGPLTLGAGTQQGGVLVSDGAATLGTWSLAGGAEFDNLGTLTLGNFANLGQAAGDTSAVLFRNSGTVVGATAPSAWAGIGVPVVSTGPITVASGTLGIGEDGANTVTGPASAAPGTYLYFGGPAGTVTTVGGLNAAGATVGFTGYGTFILGGAYEAGATRDNNPYSHATLDFTGPNPAPGSLAIAGTVDFSPSAGSPETISLDSLAVFDFGTLSGTDDVVVNGPATLVTTGAGDPETLAVPRLEAEGPLTLGAATQQGGVLVSDGAAAVGGWRLAAGAVLENRGAMTLGRFATLTQAAGDTSAVLFRNAGTVIGAAGPDYATVWVPTDSPGAVQVVSGSLGFGGGSSFSGPLTAAPGTDLGFGTGAGGDFNITGDISAAGATVTFYSPGTYAVASSYRAGATIADYRADVYFTGPVLGVGTLTFGGSFGGNASVDFSPTPAAGGPETITATSVAATGILASHGSMTLEDAGNFTATNTLHLALDGSDGSRSDRINVGGAASIGGTFQLELGPEFTARVGDVFTLIDTANGLTGTFAARPEGSAISLSGYQFQISYANGDVTLTTIGVPFHQTTTTVTASANSPLLGDTVTLTATVTSDPGAGAPIGTVQFQVNGTNLGDPVPLVNGTASLTTAALPAGADTITAAYSGGSGFLLSSGSTTVNVLPLSSLSGIAWEDFNNDGQVDFGEKGIHGVQVTLTGTDDLGNAVNLPPQTTDADGAYVFLNLRPGNYRITETQPAGYLQGIDSVGTAGGRLVATDQFLVPLGPGVNGLNYNFGEQPTATGPVQRGQTAGIGFWNNKNGQALIKSFNGGTGTELADWLAATLPNMFGIHAGSNNLTGKNNAFVANLFQQDFLLKGVKLDAQVLATALSVYATNATLDSTGVAAQYGFTVSGDGVGTAAVNVGGDGAAFGVANNTVLTVMDLLFATDAQAVNGVLYGGNTTKRTEANDVYGAVNQAGGL